jgi:hypothetical protein
MSVCTTLERHVYVHKREYLIDSFGLSLNPTKARVEESEGGKLRYTVIPGRLSVCDTVNGNRRRYPRKVWEKNLQDGSPLIEAIKKNAAFGLLEHPKDGHVDLNSPIAVLTTKAILVEEGPIAAVEGEIRILDTAEGRRLCALIEAGYRPTVSSRGYGTLITAPDGIADVQDDYVCEGWDVVATPSFIQAVLDPFSARESADKSPKPETAAAVVEGKQPTKVSEGASAQEIHKQPTKTMDVKTIRESLASFNGVDPSKLGAVEFAQGMARLNDLHNEVASYVAEDRKRDWEGTTLHKSISAVEEAWAKAVTAPREENAKLRENQTKLLRIIKELGTAAQSFKTKLGEALKAGDRKGKVNESLASRARQWMATSKQATKDASSLEERYAIATEALDILAAKYKADMAALGRRVLQLEFANLTDKEKKTLSEAKTPQAVVRCRTALEEARGIKRGKKVDEAKPKTEADKPKVDEAKPTDAPKAEADKPKVDEAKPKTEDKPKVEEAAAPKVEILRNDRGMTLSESIGVTRRLSTTRAG